MVSRYALRGSERKAKSSLALEGAFNWIRLIRLNLPLTARRKRLFKFDRRDNPRRSREIVPVPRDDDVGAALARFFATIGVGTRLARFPLSSSCLFPNRRDSRRRLF